MEFSVKSDYDANLLELAVIAVVIDAIVIESLKSLMLLVSSYLSPLMLLMS
jgi:hypothetical protein